MSSQLVLEAARHVLSQRDTPSNAEATWKVPGGSDKFSISAARVRTLSGPCRARARWRRERLHARRFLLDHFGDHRMGRRRLDRIRRIELLAAQQAIHLVAVEHLALEQRLRQQMQAIFVVLEELERTLIAGLRDLPDLAVDRDRGFLAVVLVGGD